jgi:acetolactate synthase regulatory subunit
MEQEFERRRVKITEACHTDFRSKTDAALVRYKQGRETLECQVRDLETELRGAHEVRRGAEHALAEADATIASLRRDIQRLEEENSASVLQVVEISRELQEARDSEAEARVLRRQRVQMFRGFSACVMAAVHRLGIHGLNLPTVPKDDGSIMLFFSQLAEQLDGVSAKVLSSSTPSAGSCWGSRGRESSPTFNASTPTSTWKRYCRGRRLHRQELLTARRWPGQGNWTSPCDSCRPSTPALEHPSPQTRRAPPAATPPALGSPAARKLGRRTTKRRSPVERRPQAPAKAPTMTRATQRSPSKPFLDLLQKNRVSCTLGSRQTLPCWAILSCNRT